MAATLTFSTEDPGTDDVRELLARHLAFSRAITPPEHAYVVESDGLSDPDITLVGARRGGTLLAVGAIRELDPDHAELKSMHVAAAARGQGVGRALATHLLSVAAERGYRRLSLETGTVDAFAPARELYRSLGFVPCAPFGGYTESPHNTFMTLGPLDGEGGDRPLARFVAPANGERRAPEPAPGSAPQVRPDRTGPVPSRGP